MRQKLVIFLFPREEELYKAAIKLMYPYVKGVFDFKVQHAFVLLEI